MSPVLLDLDDNGIEVAEVSRSNIYMDASGDGLLHRTAWAGAGDGVLFFDPDGRNDITEKRQYVFTEWDPTAKGDLEAIRSVFDSNGDGKLTAADADFAKFKVMVTNADGSTSVMTLAALGITEIDLSPDATNIRMDDGSVITGQTEFTRSDGSTGTVANTVLVAEAMGHNVEQTESVDGAGVRTVETLAYAADGSLAYGITSVTSADGSSIVNSYDDDGDGAVDRIQVIDTVVNGDGSITETLANYRGAVVATAILVSRKVVTDSADGLVKTIERDSTGGDWFDQREVQTTNGDDSRTVLLEDLAKDGSVIRGYSETISVDGLTRVRSVDEDGDGLADQVTQHVIVINGDGSRDEVVTVLNQDGSLRAEVEEDIASDGRSKVVARDLDGDGDADTVEVTDISVAGDGTTVSVLDIENGDGSLRSSVTQSQSADALTKTSASDVDGDGDVDLTVVDATVINGDGSRERVVTATNLDGSVNSMVKETLGADKVTSQTWVDQNQDGVFQATDLVKDVTVDGVTGERTATVWGRNADGSVHSQSVSVTSEDGLTRLTDVDADGDGDTDTEISDVTVIDGAGVSTRTVETRNGDGSLRSSSETVSSADGLSTVTEVDIDGDGVVDGHTEDLRVLNGDGSVTRTVSEYAGDGVTLLSETVTEQSADRRVSTVTVDSDGDGFTDAVIGSVLNEDGSRTVTTVTYAPDGSAVSERETTLSANELVATSARDADGDGTDETLTTETTVLNADGSRATTVDIDNGNGTDRSQSVTEISDDGLEVSIQTDADGDGTFERVSESVTVLGSDGFATETVETRSTDDSLLSRTRITQSDDGLTTTTETDGDGDGDYDLIRETETILLDGGGTQVTSELREADGTLRNQTVVTSSDDGRLVTTGTDVNGDGVDDMTSVRTEANDGSVTRVEDELNADGSLQSRATSVVSDDGLTVVTAKDLDGDRVDDRVTETETVLNVDGSRTTTVEHKSSNGTIYATSEVTVSDDGLVRISADDWNNDGAIDVTETDTLSIAIDGETTRTVVQVAADASILNTYSEVTSADGRTVVESFDIDGDGNIDRVLTSVEADDGSVGVTEDIYSHGGVLVGTLSSTISADGLTATEVRDRNADGIAEFYRLDTTRLREDGFVEREIVNTDGYHVGKASQYYLTSDDGLYQYSELDLDGDGVIESATEAETVFEDDGDTITVQVVRDSADDELARIEARTTGNGLVTEIAEDYTGDGSVDRTSTLTREADGAWSETVTQYGSGYKLQQSVTEAMSADGRTHTVTADLDGDGFEDRRILAETDLSRTVTTTYEDIARDGSVETTVTGNHSANGMFTEYAFDIDGDGVTDIARTTELEYLADGAQVETFTETYGGNIVYQEVTTRSADGLSATGTIDMDGDGDIDGTTGSVTTLNDDGSSTTVSDVYYADGDLRTRTTQHISADRRTTTTSTDYDGNGIADKKSTVKIGIDGDRWEQEQAFNEGGMPGQVHATWTSPDGLYQSIRRVSDATQTTNYSHTENGSYTWDNGLTAAYGVTDIRVEHEFDGLGIETWTSTEKTKDSNGDPVNNTYTVRIDAAAKQQAIAEAARIFDTALDRSMDFTEIEVLVKYVEDGQLDQAQLMDALLASGEFATRYGTMTDAEFITQLYLNTYGRSPSLDELDEQLRALDDGSLTRGELAVEMSESVEHIVVGNGHMSTNNFDVIMNPAVFERSLDEAYVRAQIENLVDVVYDRDATEQELSYLSERLLNGTDNLDDIAGTLLGLEGDMQGVGTNSLKGLNNEDLVTQGFVNALGREPTAEELQTWTDNLNSGRITKAQFVASLAQSVEHLEAGNGHVQHDLETVSVQNGGNGNDDLDGTSGQDALFGGNGNDELKGREGSDWLEGGAGDDELDGGTGNDFYIWSKGDGSDEIDDRNSIETELDTLVLTDVLSSEVTLRRIDSGHIHIEDLQVVISGPGGDEVITVQDQFDKPDGDGIEQIEFSDGEVWTLDDILAKTKLEGTSGNDSMEGQSHVDNLFGLDGNDTLDGNAGDDHLTGGGGNDTLKGDDGNDTYYWSRGDGSDEIDDNGADITEVDRLVLIDVTSDEVQLIKDEDSIHLTIQISGADGGEIFVRDRFQNITEGDGIEVIEFSDGEVWTLDDIITKSKVIDDDNASTMDSTKYADSLYGMGGNDTLVGNEGDDLLVGGTGDDTLKGGAGDDRYEWSKGDGNDLIDDNSTSKTESDTLTLLDVNSDDVVLRRVVDGGGTETDEMEIEIISTGEKITIKNQFEDSSENKGIEAIVFADGEAWYGGDIYRQIVTEGSGSGDSLDGDGNVDILHGLGGNDTIDGEGSNDVLVGGAGDDTLDGGSGNDTFLWSLGDGNDTIRDTNSYQNQRDTLKLLDVASTGVSYAISGNDLLVTVTTSGEVLTLDDVFHSDSDNVRGVDFIEFSDGVVMEIASSPVAEMTVTGTSGNDTLDGWAYGDVIEGLDGDDALSGGHGDDTLIGGLGADSVDGGLGSDTYFWSKGDGEEFLDDRDASLEDTDTLVLTDVLASEVTLYRPNTESYHKDDLHIQIAGLGVDGHFHIVDQFNGQNGKGIERLVFADGEVWTHADFLERTVLEGTNGGETIVGQSGRDNLFGLDGDDTLNGNDGDDHLTGGLGADTLHGDDGNDTYHWAKGDGNDTLDDSNSNTSETDTLVLTDVTSDDVRLYRSGDITDVQVEIISTGETITIKNRYENSNDGRGVEAIVFADGETWTLDDIRAQTVYEGTSGTDSLDGKNYRDNLYGFDGDDTLEGHDGDDLLEGGLGEDYVRGDAGSDTYIWSKGDGDDLIDDATTSLTDVDTLVLTDVGSSDVALRRTSGSADLRILILSTGETITDEDRYNNSNDGRGIEKIVFSDGEVWTLDEIRYNTIVVGSSGNDTLTGSNYKERLNGLDGNDVLYGNGGDDVLIGGLGADTLNGGNGVDLVTYWNSTQGVKVDLGESGAQQGNSGGEEVGDVLVNIENLQGSQYNDNLFGDDESNDLYGSAGNDLLKGNGGYDRLYGGDGNDKLRGGAGADFLAGGNGEDSAQYQDASEGVIADLLDPSQNAGYAEGDIYVSIENFNGSSYDDILRGDDGDNKFWSSGGDDILIGRGGNDFFSGGPGGDLYDGGDGVDTVTYTFSGGAVTIDLLANTASGDQADGDQFIDIEKLIGSDYDDFIYGDNGANIFEGADGDDTIDGRGGDDVFLFDDGTDTIRGGSGSDTVVIDRNLSSATFSTSGNDILISTPDGTIILEDQLLYAQGTSDAIVEFVEFKDTTLDEADILEQVGALANLEVYIADGGQTFSSPVVSYGGNQDYGEFALSEGGAKLTLTDNAWKQILVDVTVDEDTVLEFDFSSSLEGEVHGIGFDTDSSLSPTRVFQLSGTQDWGIDDYDGYVTGSGTQHYVIPVGQFYTGDFSRIVFVMDDDSGPTGDSVFSNIEVL